MLIRSSRTLAAWICCTCFALAAEPPAPPPVAPRKVETNFPVVASYPGRLRPAQAQQTERAIVHLPESVVLDLAAKLQEKRSGILPVGGSYDTTPRNLPHGATIIAGIALSVAMVSFVLMPRRRRLLTGVAGAAGLVFVSLVTVNFSQANAPAPPRKHAIVKPNPLDQCLIMIVRDGEEVEIFVKDK